MSFQFPGDAPVANPVFYRSYSRRTSEGRETWEQVVERNLEALRRLGHLDNEQIKLLRHHQLNLTSLPSGRWLWVGGTPWLERPENFSGAYNCTSTNVRDWESFALMMDLAMMGSGTGAVLEQRHIEQLPDIVNTLSVEIQGEIGSKAAEERVSDSLIHSPEPGTLFIEVGDSRQGWVEAYWAMLEEASSDRSDSSISAATTVVVDLSNIRPPGEPLQGFGGTANPVQLPELFSRIAAITNGAVGRQLNALECCLLIDEAAKTVVAGNIRRSAGMRQFSEEDRSALDAKASLWTQDDSGNWIVDPAKDALRMANHTRVFHHRPSYEEVRDSVAKQYVSGEGAIQFAPEALVRANADLLQLNWLQEAFLDAYEEAPVGTAAELLSSLEFGHSDLAHLTAAQMDVIEHRMSRYGLNPCGEILGSDFHCNLAEVHLNRLDPDDPAEVSAAFRAAAITVAVLLHHEFQEDRYDVSRRLDPIVGVSFTGLFDYCVKAFGVEWLQWWQAGRPPTDKGLDFKAREAEMLRGFRREVEDAVASYCTDHDLKVPNRCTTVQPAGSKSLLTNASPGWHPPKSARYVRRVTFGKNDPIALACMDYGYAIVPSQSDKDAEGRLLDDPFDPRCTEWLVEIPVETVWADLPGADGIDTGSFSALAQFDFYMQVQRIYTGHNTSATIEFREDEIEPLSRAIHAAITTDRGYISAALLARFDDKETFPRLPYEPVDRATYEQLHADVLARRGDTDFFAALCSRDAAGQVSQEQAGPAGCDSDACMLPLKGAYLGTD